MGVRWGRHSRVALVAVTAAVAIVSGVFAHRLSSDLDAMAEQFRLETGPQASLLYDRNNRLVFSIHDEERIDRHLSDVSPAVVTAVLSAEDRNFQSHPGVDFVRMGGAAIEDLKAGHLWQGASTITQQLVRLQALGRERTWSRKLREILLALRVERRFSKDEILETYLNRIYLGDGYFGVEAAARGYFDKGASDLDVSEAALLAGIIKCPSTCSPRSQPERARKRRDIVLRAMLENGDVPTDVFNAALANVPTIKERRGAGIFPVHQDGNDPSGLYFIDAVRRELNLRFGEGAVLRGGLRVYMTLEPRLQRLAEDAITARLDELDAQEAKARRKRSDNVVQGSLVAIDPRTGEVLALVGGRDFHQTPFNRAVQALRQPGSAFKPIVYAAALENGYLPATLLDHLDEPVEAGKGEWMPAGEHEATSYTLRQALVKSSNRAAVRLLEQVGISATRFYAKQLGITTPTPSIPSLALGTAEVSLIDLTSVYGVFADNGTLMPRTLISRVEDSAGDILWQPSSPPQQVLHPATAFLMSSMLADVINRGTGSEARGRGFKLPAAGKTGTTTDAADAWFIGYTPNLVAGVWFGRDQPEEIVPRASAAKVAVPAWARFMKAATANHRPDWYQPPSSLEKVPICQVSGMRATQACRLAAANRQGAVIDDFFPKGTAPREPCSVHVERFTLPGVVEMPIGPQPAATTGTASPP